MLAKQLLILLIFFTLTTLTATCNAVEYGARISSAELTISNNWYVLNAEIPITLSPIAKEALQNSISQVWEIQVKLSEHRRYIWDKSIFSAKFSYRIRYHPLLKMYQVKQENSGRIVSFSTMNAAFNVIESINDLKIIEQHLLQEPENLIAAIKINLIKERLPLHLRPLAYFNPGWYLSSDWFQWPVQK